MRSLRATTPNWAERIRIACTVHSVGICMRSWGVLGCITGTERAAWVYNYEICKFFYRAMMLAASSYEEEGAKYHSDSATNLFQTCLHLKQHPAFSSYNDMMHSMPSSQSLSLSHILSSSPIFRSSTAKANWSPQCVIFQSLLDSE